MYVEAGAQQDAQTCKDMERVALEMSKAETQTMITPRQEVEDPAYR